MMRKQFSSLKLVCAAVLMIGTFGASPALAQGFGVQIMGGPLFSSLTDLRGFKTENTTNYLVGIGLGGNRGGVLGVEGDFLYGQKGVKVNGIDFNTKVLHMPVMLKVNLGAASASGFRAFVLGGTYFDWQFDSTRIPNITQDTTGFEVGYVIGGGFEILRLSVQGRYIRGLTELDRTFTLPSGDAHTTAFALLFGFRLN